MIRNFLILFFVVLFVSAGHAQESRIGVDKLILGKPGSAASKSIEFGGTNQKIRANASNSKLEFTLDGSLYKAIGSGSGTGSGEINILLNPNAEDLTANWTLTGSGTFTTVSAVDQRIDGEQSFRVDFAAQNDVLKSDEVTIPKGLYGRACEARITFYGGDDKIDFEVRNGDDELLGSHSLAAAQAIAAPQSVFFKCPTAADIAGDADKGVLYFQIKQVDSGDAPPLTFDNGHLGALIGLVETTLPDTFSAKVADGSATTTVSGENADWINGNCTNPSAGVYVCSFNAGVFPSVAPNCFAEPVQAGSNGISTKVTAVSTSSVSLEIRNNGSTPAVADHDFNLFCTKAGSDAKQSVQVYKSIPKVAENINNFTARIDGTVSPSTVTLENTDWINGNCSRSATGRYSCNFVASTFSSPPNCTCVAEGSNSPTCNINSTGSVTSSAINLAVVSGGGADANTVFYLSCSKSSSDFKLPTVQPVIIGQVTNSAAESGIVNVRTESCKINNSGSATVDTSSGLCAGWISSVNRSATGVIDVVFNAGVCSAPPVCTADPQGAATNANVSFADSPTASGLTARMIMGDNNAIDRDLHLTCSCRR
jgi:hypothetical protein